MPADAELAAGNELVVADDAAIKTAGGLITVSGTTGKVNGFTAPADTTVSLSDVAAASSKTTITLGADLVVPAAASTTLAIPASVTLDAGLSGVTLQADKTNQGTLEVESGGTLKVGATEITDKWEPAKASGDATLSVTIRMLLTEGQGLSNNTGIHGDAAFIATSSGSGAITQTAGTVNLLVIGTGTTVDLGNDGKIVLKAHDSETAKSGAVGFSTGTATAAVIKTGNTAGNGNTGKIKGAATTGSVTLASTGSTNKLATITSTTDDADIRPEGTTDDLTIDKSTDVEDTP